MTSPLQSAVDAYLRLLGRLDNDPTDDEVKEAEEVSKSPHLDGNQSFQLKDRLRKVKRLRVKD